MRFDFKPEIKETIDKLWHGYVERGCFFVRKRCKEVAGTCDNNLVDSLHRMLNCYFAHFFPTELKEAKAFAEEVKEFVSEISPLFIFCYMWTIGGAIDGASRPKFAEYVWKTLTGTAPAGVAEDLVEHPPPDCGATEVNRTGLEDLGRGVNLYDYFYDIQRINQDGTPGCLFDSKWGSEAGWLLNFERLVLGCMDSY